MSTDDTTTPQPDPDAPVIPAGKALLAVSASMLDVLAAVGRMEATCAAVARALDATATTKEGR